MVTSQTIFGLFTEEGRYKNFVICGNFETSIKIKNLKSLLFKFFSKILLKMNLKRISSSRKYVSEEDA